MNLHHLALRRTARPMLAGVLVAALQAMPVMAQGTLSSLDKEVERIASGARPSVVTVIAERDEPVTAQQGQATTRTMVRIGSGVAVARDAIVTTASVALGSERFEVRTSNGLRADAELLGADPIFNVAVLRVKGVRLPALAFAGGRPTREGDWVMAIGTSNHRMNITESVGSIAYRHQEPRIPLLQLTNTVYPGYSGGAVLNVRGELIGIVLGQLGGSDAPGWLPGAARMSFVLTGETVRYVYDKIRTEGRVPHGYLGVSTRTEFVSASGNQEDAIPIGARVESVVPGGPAQAVGLEPGDIIVGFERERVEVPEQLARWVAATAPGTSVRLVWVRDEFQHTGVVELDESPQQVPLWAVREANRRQNADNPSRISDIERQIRRLTTELERLKTDPVNNRN